MRNLVAAEYVSRVQQISQAVLNDDLANRWDTIYWNPGNTLKAWQICIIMFQERQSWIFCYLFTFSARTIPLFLSAPYLFSPISFTFHLALPSRQSPYLILFCPNLWFPFFLTLYKYIIWEDPFLAIYYICIYNYLALGSQSPYLLFATCLDRQTTRFYMII